MYFVLSWESIYPGKIAKSFRISKEGSTILSIANEIFGKKTMSIFQNVLRNTRT